MVWQADMETQDAVLPSLAEECLDAKHNPRAEQEVEWQFTGNAVVLPFLQAVHDLSARQRCQLRKALPQFEHR